MLRWNMLNVQKNTTSCRCSLKQDNKKNQEACQVLIPHENRL